MKRVGKILLSILVIIYAATAMFLTTCLLKYNDYKITEFGDKSLIIVSDDVLEENYKKGSLLIVDKNGVEIEDGDNIIFYNTYNNQVSIAISEVLSKKEITDTETTYTVSGNYDISSEYLIGSEKSVKVLPVLGTILGILESRVGFLIFIIFPITLAFLYEIYALVSEIKESKKEENKESKKEEVKEEKELEETTEEEE